MKYSYADHMSGENPYLIMNIKTERPIELSEFVIEIEQKSYHIFSSFKGVGA